MTRRRASPLLLVGLGATSALAPLSASMLLVALPDLRRDLTLDATSAGLLVSVYLAAMVLLQPLGGRLGDAWGHRRALLIGIALFAAASLLASVAPDYSVLVAARMLQAGAGGLAFPNAFAVVRNAVPATRRGRVLGLLGAAMVVMSAAAIPLGALAVMLGGWRATFVFAAVFAVVALVAVGRDAGRTADAQPPDGVSHIERRAGPAQSERPAHSVGAAAFSLGLANAAMYAYLVWLSVAPHAAGGPRDSGPWLIFAFLAASIFGAAGGGHLADRIGRGRPAMWGLGAMAIGLIPLLFGETALLWTVVGGSTVAGLGAGAATTSLQTIAADAASAEHTGRAAGALASARYVGAAVGSTLASMAAATLMHGLSVAILIAMVCALGALVATVWLVTPAHAESPRTDMGRLTEPSRSRIIVPLISRTMRLPLARELTERPDSV